MTQGRTAVIIGAGPAGLTAAWELLDRTDIRPVVLEMTADIGGIARTSVFKGNRIDIGGHRFFSKSDRVMAWWLNILPHQGAPSRDDLVLGRRVPLERQAVTRTIGGPPVAGPAPDPERADRVMLVRQRLSRILFLKKFFAYPITLSLDTVSKLGLRRMLRMGFSYLRIAAGPRLEERSLEDFFINRFGRELYETFFRDYTEKVWGVPCSTIRPEWGAQRVKGLSVRAALWHAATRPFRRRDGIAQRGTETSLIERFLYPKFGPGQMWEAVAGQVRDAGGEIHLGQKVIGVEWSPGRVGAVVTEDAATGRHRRWGGEFFFSSMAIQDFIEALGEGVPPPVLEVASGLIYRDFITVGVLVRRLALRNESRIPSVGDIIPDNWIYVQEPEVKIGRIQIFNNWSPYLVADPDTVWLGVEYFCTRGDGLWSLDDGAVSALAVKELEAIGVIDPTELLDTVVIRQEKTYPAYFGTYDRLGEVRGYLNGFENLFSIGRNGQHKYNNQDHSMLCAMAAVDHLADGGVPRESVWDVNAEPEYHEEK